MTSTPAQSRAKELKDAMKGGKSAPPLPGGGAVDAVETENVFQLPQVIKAILTPLASLKITVVLFALALFLILAGTLAQVDYGIWTVMADYFRTFIAQIELQIFMPNAWAKNLNLIRDDGSVATVPFFGGYTLGLAMMINLIAAHAIRFKVSAEGQRLLVGTIGSVIGLGVIVYSILISSHTLWPFKSPLQFWPVLGLSTAGLIVLTVPSLLLYGKRTGIVLLHAGVIMMLVNEAVTGLGAVEGQMAIEQRGTSNYVYDIERAELAIIDIANPSGEKVIAVPDDQLQDVGRVIRDERLPFDIKVVKYMKNSRLIEVEAAGSAKNPATKGRLGQAYIAEPLEVGKGTDSNMKADIGSVYLTLLKKGGSEELGTYLFTTHREYMEPIVHDGYVLKANMRFAREYKPYSIHLLEFRHDKFVGTNKPRNFSSRVLLIDDDHPQGREVTIRMNEPLRYKGETFFQSSFLTEAGNDALGTVLQVVRNPGWLIPYIACMVVSLGMIMHFALTLSKFVKKISAG